MLKGTELFLKELNWTVFLVESAESCRDMVKFSGAKELGNMISNYAYSCTYFLFELDWGKKTVLWKIGDWRKRDRAYHP